MVRKSIVMEEDLWENLKIVTEIHKDSISSVVFVNPKVHHLSIEKYTTLSKKIIAPSATFQFL